MGPLVLFAADCCGETYPGGIAITDVFGVEDAAAALYLSELYSQPGRQCWVHDADIDGDCHPEVDQDALSEAEFVRLDQMRALDWTESVFAVQANVNGRHWPLRVTFHQDKNAWYGSTESAGIWAKDRFQVMARLAALAYPMAETQVQA